MGASLNLWKRHLGQKPESVWSQTDLERLILADNDLIEVSERIAALKNLRTLDLGHNQLGSLPDALGELVGLTDFLYLHDNRLSALPPSLARLTKLRYLNLSANAFEEFPECVCRMVGLIKLRASDNRLTLLPESIGNLTSLRPAKQFAQIAASDNRRAQGIEANRSAR
jgi:Leucine-rich repeat (LRR) protein